MRSLAEQIHIGETVHRPGARHILVESAAATLRNPPESLHDVVRILSLARFSGRVSERNYAASCRAVGTCQGR